MFGTFLSTLSTSIFAGHTLALVLPRTYNKLYANFSDNPQAERMKALISELFQKILGSGSHHAARLREMLEALPEGVSRTVSGLVDHRFRMVELPEPAGKVAVGGTDFDLGAERGMYYVGSGPIEPFVDGALPFIMAHEMGHVFARDAIVAGVVATGTATAVAIAARKFGKLGSCATFVFSALAGVCAACLYLRCVAEPGADAFAIEHTTSEERQGAIAFFREIDGRVTTMPLKNRFVSRVLHPSVESRIAAIEASLGSAPL